MLRIFNLYLPRRTLFLVIFENLFILATLHLTAMHRTGKFGGAQNAIFLKAAVIAIVCQLSLYFHDLYDFQVVSDSRELFIRLVQAFGVCCILVASFYLLFPQLFLGEGVFFIAVFLLLAFLFLWRILFFSFSSRRGLRQAALILGTGKLARKLAQEITNRPEVGIRIVGFLEEVSTRGGESELGSATLGNFTELLKIVAEEKVSRIVVAMSERRGVLPVAQLLDLKMRGLVIEEGTALYEKVTGKIAVENLRPSWLIFSPGFSKSKLTRIYKRIFGMGLSVVGLALLSPFMVLIAILIKLDSRGPVFFKQERIGENGKVFHLLKFRSMYVDAEEETGPVWAQKNDARVTRVGMILRKIRLDEVPQFINVLRGDMSFVGPRPERPHFVKQLMEKIPYYHQRHTVKPGITGWAQTKYQYGSSFDDTLEKLQFDLFYIKNMSLSLDLFIIFQTVKIVMLGRGAH